MEATADALLRLIRERAAEHARAERLEAENMRLRVALRDFSAQATTMAARMARAALAGDAPAKQDT